MPLTFKISHSKDQQLIKFNSFTQLCRHLGYQEFKTCELIMKQGDESDDKLYVIVEGKVGIVIAKDTNVFKNEETHKNNKQTSQQKELQPTCGSQLYSKNQQDHQKYAINDDSTLTTDLDDIIDHYGTKVNELTKGDGFGEKALILTPQVLFLVYLFKKSLDYFNLRGQKFNTKNKKYKFQLF